MKYVGENLSNNRRDFSHDRNLRPRDSHFGLDLEYTLFLLNMLFLELFDTISNTQTVVRII